MAPIYLSSAPAVRTIRLRDGRPLEVAEQGDRDAATTVVMLHGITDSWRSFDPLLPWLPPEWRVIVPSQRGHGGSPHRGWSTYTTREFADDVATLLDAMAVRGPVVVVGHSMGAANAIRFASEHPQRVRGLVAAGAFASFVDKDDLLAFFSESIATLRDPVPYALAHDFQASTVAGPVAEGLIEAMTQESLKVPAAVWRGAFSALFEDDFEPEKLACPTLLVWGDADAFVPAADTQRLAAAIDDVRVVAFRGVGHALHWEQPARFARELVHFVASLGERAAA